MNRYREMLDFYSGNQWDRRRRPGETRLTVNYARALVRKTVSYVFSEPVSFSVAASKTSGVSEELAAAVETRLNELYVEQDLHSLDFNTMVDAAVVGDGAFKITWDVDAGAPVVTSVDPGRRVGVDASGQRAEGHQGRAALLPDGAGCVGHVRRRHDHRGRVGSGRRGLDGSPATDRGWRSDGAR